MATFKRRYTEPNERAETDFAYLEPEYKITSGKAAMQFLYQFQLRLGAKQ
eukprot:CAMPEP_0204852814 /NCGR_PEP_ID=MMETSP1347-20130617/12367_1 /ASSEMBLY_ACC=CAM_ASM_000690 /TAXON_ID=215587 /ORGANISM="Aplanochytrium stocchinoi, Strain GSBS06" /LENGTH=49 /DNA_ID=CAMNT_0051997273 /DNA_START=354 /DNA_END=503 /DNA_ORIENTATION=-